MAKLKTPLIALNARGSIGDITYLRRRNQDIVEKKPRLPYFLTLPVQYQRWLYEDYCYHWHQQSLATQAAYRSDGVRHHLTGFQYWMKYNLTNLPDIELWYKLDRELAGVAYDSSRNNHDAPIIGASPTDSVIQYGLIFDGINDSILSPVRLPLTGTIELWMEPTNQIGTVQEMYLGVMDAALDRFQFYNWNAGWGVFGWVIGGAGGGVQFWPPWPAGWLIVHYDWDNVSSTCHLYFNNVFIGQNLLVPALLSVPLDLGIGCRNNNGVLDFWGDTKMDNFILYNRVLTPAERQRHLERAWP